MMGAPVSPARRGAKYCIPHSKRERKPNGKPACYASNLRASHSATPSRYVRAVKERTAARSWTPEPVGVILPPAARALTAASWYATYHALPKLAAACIMLCRAARGPHKASWPHRRRG